MRVSDKLLRKILLISAFGLSACASDHSVDSVALGRSKARVDLMCQALDSFALDHQSMLKVEDGFQALLGQDQYLRTGKALTDGWGRAIEPLVKNGEIVGAVSLGKDGLLGSSDDILCNATGGAFHKSAISGVTQNPRNPGSGLVLPHASA